MTIRELLVFALIGLGAGWIATRLLEGRSRGLAMSLALGVVGAFVGPVILEFLELTATGLVGALVAATVGAMALLLIAQVVGSLRLVLIGAIVVLIVLAGGIQLR